MISAKRGIQQLVSGLHVLSEGKEQIDCILSPGSRNAPLSISFYGDSKYKTHVIVDERSAAFIAMGMSLSTNRASILCCTSGTAALNYAPAIAEAYYQRIPLLICTADRPQERIDQGAGQSIRQNKLYHNYVQSSYQWIQEADTEEAFSQNREILTQIAMDLINYQRPVHLNIPLCEPLYDQDPDPLVFEAIHCEKVDPIADPRSVQVFNKELKEAQNIFIFLGQLAAIPDELYNQLQIWSDQGAVIFSESLAQINANFILHSPELTIRHGALLHPEKFRPDIFITIGGAIISKSLRKWIKGYTGLNHYHISDDYFCPDVFEKGVRHLQAYPEVVLNNSLIETHGYYRKLWIEIDSTIRSLFNRKMREAPWSDVQVFNYLAEYLPEDVHIHVSNSSAIRYLDLFDYRSSNIFSNRGVGGIDGCTSTALGYSLKSKNKTILITGDLAFHYDSNALWNKLDHSNLIIILINNQGGGIFNMIPGPDKTSIQQEAFVAEQYRTAEYIAAQNGAQYFAVRDQLRLHDTLSTVVHSDRCVILEIFTPGNLNAGVIKHIHTELSQELAGINQKIY